VRTIGVVAFGRRVLIGVTGAANQAVWIKRRSLRIVRLCRIHSLEIHKPRSGAQVVDKFPLPLTFQECPSFILNCGGLEEAQFAKRHLTPGPLLQNGDFQDSGTAGLQIQEGVADGKVLFYLVESGRGKAADCLKDQTSPFNMCASKSGV
jgi:hypothetical protein